MMDDHQPGPYRTRVAHARARSRAVEERNWKTLHMPLRFTQRILQHLAHDIYHPVPIRELAKEMRIDAEQRELFDEAIRQLDERGDIEIDATGRVRLPAAPDELAGMLKVNARGFGFVMPDKPVREGDIFIPPSNLGDAISGDRVRIRMGQDKRAASPAGGRGGAGRARGRGRVGRVIEVLERGQTHFVGVLERRGSRWFVIPDGNSLHQPVLVHDPHAKNAKPGDKVVLELLHYPEGNFQSEGVITQVLGEAGRPDVETRAVILAHGLRDHFPEAAINEARHAARLFEEVAAGPWPGRMDLTDVFTITIDPPDAKDFDDAITLEYHPREREWTLGVHIADVATFVKRGSVLDDEARERGNSVYLPRLVLPMLPELLSNGVCSLQEGVPRFTKSVFITFDGEGTVLGQRLANAVIRSDKRLTYLEAQALIDGDQKAARLHARTETPYTDQLIDALRRADQLARILQKRRYRDGMITLNLPQVVLVHDEEGRVIDAQPEDGAFTHKLIEMFMVEANEALARTFDDLGVPILRRTHPDPAMGNLDDLRMYARAVGVSIPDRPTRKEMQHLLDVTRDTPAARAIHFAVLRTFTKATYSPALIGHYALASQHYAHFTSPIRRYPDLTLHRVMQAYLERTDNGASVPGGRKRRQLGELVNGDERVLDEGELVTLGRHCSATEVEAAEAERELREFLVMQLLLDRHMGDEFSGLVTGVMSAGVFVSINKYLVEGLVKSTELPGTGAGGRGDQWRINDRTGRLTAGRSGATIGVGDIVTVSIARIDLAARRMDLLIRALPDATTSPFVGRAQERSAKRDLKKEGVSLDPAGHKHRKGYRKGRRGRKPG